MTLSLNHPTVLIAASGTGGHLFPALQIAHGFRKQFPEARIEFVGSGRPLEAALIDPTGFKRHELPAIGLKRRGVHGMIEFIVSLPSVVARAWRLHSSLKPDIVVGVGGYASFFPVLLAALRGTPTWIHEAELRPGLTNYILSIFVRRVSLAFVEARLPFWARSVYTGHPVRSEVLAVGREPHNSEQPRRILITGGSQGAATIDLACAEIAGFMAQHGMEVLHQCRVDNIQKVTTQYQVAGVQAEVLPFIADMAQAYRWCDLIICRSGAGTVMEVGVVNRPAIFVPLATAAGNEQEANANTLAVLGKALVVRDDSALGQKLKEAMTQIMDQGSYKVMLQAPNPGRSLAAIERIVQGCSELINVTNAAK